MNTEPIRRQDTPTTRTFTADEEAVLVRALIAFRRVASPDDLDLIDGILRDGWQR